MSERRGQGPVQLLGFGEQGTPGRRYRVVCPGGRVVWAGHDIGDAMIYLVRNGLALDMEKNKAGEAFVREAERIGEFRAPGPPANDE